MRALIPSLLMLLPAIASGDDSRLRQCRALLDRAERLACYDAIPLASPASASASRAAVAASSAPASTAARANPPTEERFGLPQRRDAAAPETIRSAVAPGFTGWGAGSRITLANGQVWKVVDGTTGVVGRDIRQVTVKRGFMGAYYLRFDGMNKAPKVERVQ